MDRKVTPAATVVTGLLMIVPTIATIEIDSNVGIGLPVQDMGDAEHILETQLPLHT